MAGTSADKFALLRATKADLKAALIEKGQTPGDKFSDYPDMVRAIQTGATLPTLTNPATEEQVLNGYEFIDGSGAKKTGNLVPASGGALSAVEVTITCIDSTIQYFGEDGSIKTVGLESTQTVKALGGAVWGDFPDFYTATGDYAVAAISMSRSDYLFVFKSDGGTLSEND